MTNEELTAHITEYEKEYRWLAEYHFHVKYELINPLIESLWAHYKPIVEIMRQYANDVQKEHCEHIRYYSEIDGFAYCKICGQPMQ